MNFLPSGSQILLSGKSKSKKSTKCNTISPRQPRCAVSPTQCSAAYTSETGSDTVRTKKFSISSSQSSSPSEKQSNQSKTPDAKHVRVASSTTSSSSDEPVLKFSEAERKLVGCTCDMCKVWDMGHDSVKKFTDSEVQSMINITKPPLLLKSGDDEKVEIKTLSTLPSSVALKGKKVQMPPLVVHG